MSLVDIHPTTAEDQIMDPAVKQYLDTGLAISEASFDTKLAEFRAVVETSTARAEEREAAAREREAAAREREEIRAKEVERRMQQFEASVTSVKRYIVGAALSTVFGVAGFNAALIQNYHAAFDSARHLSAVQQDIAAQRQRTEALLTAMEARLAAMDKTGSQKAPAR